MNFPMRVPAVVGTRFPPRTAGLRCAAGAWAVVLLTASIAACAGPPSPLSPTPLATTSFPPSPTFSVVVTPVPTPFAGERPELPADFPIPSGAAALPLPPRTAVIGRWSMPGFGGTAYDFYQEALPAAGYRIIASAPGGGGAIIRFEVEPGVIWQVEITGDLESTVIELWPARD